LLPRNLRNNSIAIGSGTYFAWHVTTLATVSSSVEQGVKLRAASNQPTPVRQLR
jgi:hypothetical protein